MSSDPATIARALHSAYNAHDPAAAARLYTHDGRHLEIATGGERRGGEAIAEGLASLLAAFPDLHWEERTLIANADHAAISYVMTATLQAPFGPFKPAGQRLELRGVQLLAVEDGLIASCEDYWDAASFARQMRS